MTDDADGTVDRRTLLRLSGLAAGGYAVDGVGAQEPTGTGQRATDETDRPNISGFHPVHINGLPYGERGEELPDGAAGEWADARAETVELVAAGDAPDLEAEFRRKVVGDILYFWLSVPPGEAGEPLSAEQISELRLYVDRDGTMELTDGDVRLTGQTGDDGGGLRWAVQVFDGGEFVESGSDSRPPASAAAGDSEGGGVDIEGRIDKETLEEALDDDSDDDFNISAEVGTDDQSWGINYDPTELPAAYELPGYSPTPIGGLEFENSAVMRVEVTQSVQKKDNSLPLVRDKETLVRVFVDHPESDSIEVDVELEGYRQPVQTMPPVTISGSPLTKSGFRAPPTPLDRENETDSANFRLPDSWTRSGRILLVARVNRPGHVDAGTTVRWKQVAVKFWDTYDPTIWVGRVDETSTPGRPSRNARRAAESVFVETMPVADPTFVHYGSTRIQDVAPDDNLISRLDADAKLWRSVGRTVDQLFGLTQDYGGNTAGLSSPSWSGGPGNHLAAWGDDMVTNPRVSTPTVMAHEVTHNVGGKDWALHCGADSDFSNNCTMNEVGWSPTYGIIPKGMDELMITLFDPNATNPKYWVGPDRWELLHDRFQNYVPGEPQPPGYGGPSTPPGPVETQDTHQTDGPTVRLVTGGLFEEGGGSLDPSFETPGETAEPETDPADPTAILQVEYDESTLTVPFEKSFESLHGESFDESRFSFTVPDGGGIRAVRLLDAETEEVLDAYEATGFEFDDAAIETPDVFERGEEYDLSVEVAAESDTDLLRQLMYSPDDGETWLPYSDTFRGDGHTVVFTDGPGGESSRFLLLVSDGIQTERVESDSFTVPRLPPDVEITGAHRWRVGDEELRDAADPVETVVGSETSLRAGATGQLGEALTGEAIEWTVETAAGDSVPVLGSAVGERFRHTFTKTGTYTVTATATDPETDLTDDDETTVEVGRPPLPTQDAVEQFLERESGSIAVVLVPGSQSVTPDGTSDFDIVFLGATTSVGAYELTVESGQPGAVGLVDYSLTGDVLADSSTVAEDGSAIELQVAMGEDTPDPGDITIATVTLEGREEAEVPLTVQVEQVDDANEPGESYTIAETRGASVTVSQAAGPPTVTGDDPPTDPNGDGRYEDIDGDGEADIFDVRALFNQLDDPVVQDNAEFFDFDDSGGEEVDIFDVRALFNQLE